MRENRHFVRSTDVSNRTPSLIGGVPAVSGYRALVDRIEAIAGRDAASLFAEPVLPQGAGVSGSAISWYCAFDGAVVELNDIDEFARKPVVQKLSQRLEALAPALRDAEVGPSLKAWLNLSSMNDVLSVGGEPVLINWGFLPNEVTDAAGQADHFARTIGRYAPALALAAAGPAQAPAAPLAAAAPLTAGGPQEAPPVSPASATGESLSIVTPRVDTGGGGSALPPPIFEGPAPPPRRPWVAPAIATAVAFIVLVLLLLPGVLIYPDRSGGERDTVEEQRLKSANDSLEAQLKALQDAGRDNVCRLNDAPVPVPLPQRQGAAEPPAQMELVPRPPERVALPPADANPANVSNVGELLSNASVLVFGLKEKGYGSGTGFFVSNRHIVTNHHVLKEDIERDKIFVASQALGGIRRARLIAQSQPPPSERELRIDLAVLEVDPAPNQAVLKLGVTPPKLSTAYVAGFPAFITERDENFANFINKLGSSLRNGTLEETLRERVAVPGADLKYGRVNNVMNSGRNSLPIVLHDMQLAPGNSGGPLVDACGRLGGVNTLLFRNEGGLQQANVAQDVVLLRKFLSENNIAFTGDDGACDPNANRQTADGAPPKPNPGPVLAPTPPAAKK